MDGTRVGATGRGEKDECTTAETSTAESRPLIEADGVAFARGVATLNISEGERGGKNFPIMPRHCLDADNTADREDDSSSSVNDDEMDTRGNSSSYGASYSSSNDTVDSSDYSDNDAPKRLHPGGVPRRVSIEHKMDPTLTSSDLGPHELPPVSSASPVDSRASPNGNLTETPRELAEMTSKSTFAMAAAAAAGFAISAEGGGSQPHVSAAMMGRATGVGDGSQPPQPPLLRQTDDTVPATDDEIARMMMSLMRDHSSEIVPELAERARLSDSIGWLSSHVPGCVVSSLSDEIDVVLRLEKQREQREKTRRRQRRRRRRRRRRRQRQPQSRPSPDVRRARFRDSPSHDSSLDSSDDLTSGLHSLSETDSSENEPIVCNRREARMDGEAAVAATRSGTNYQPPPKPQKHPSELMARTGVAAAASDRLGSWDERTAHTARDWNLSSWQAAADPLINSDCSCATGVPPLANVQLSNARRRSFRIRRTSFQESVVSELTQESRGSSDGASLCMVAKVCLAPAREDDEEESASIPAYTPQGGKESTQSENKGASAKGQAELKYFSLLRHQQLEEDGTVAQDAVVRGMMPRQLSPTERRRNSGVDAASISVLPDTLVPNTRTPSTRVSGINGIGRWERLKRHSIRRESRYDESMSLPYTSRHKCALLFVDISGFTKLSTLLDVESLSKAINSYFHSIVNEVTSHGGDVLKFAGDALFAAWQAAAPGTSDNHTQQVPDACGSDGSIRSTRGTWHGMNLAECVTVAASCGAKIIASCSGFPIFARVRPSMAGQGGQVATLNVHCGLGVGEVAGIHVGDNDMRREYLILGDPIDQVAAALEKAALGEFAVSPKALETLASTCRLDDFVLSAPPGEPVVIAARSQSYFVPRADKQMKRSSSFSSASATPSENLALCSEGMDTASLRQLRRLISLYVHPVVVRDELSMAEQLASGIRGSSKAQERHRAEAELRNVYVMFIKPLINAKLTGNDEEDGKLFRLLNEIMNVTSRELDRYKGHLRQFIVDDKGVIIISTFGLRGSTFPNLVTERALPCTMSLRSVLETELGVESRVGGTIGTAYCGVVGGVRRHEFAVLGPSVNLAARLVNLPHNPGVLVDNAVRLKAGKTYAFDALSPVKAKGYAELVPIFKPLTAAERHWAKPMRNFVGRRKEIMTIMKTAKDMVFESPGRSKLVFVSALSCTGKSSLAVQVIAGIQKFIGMKQRRVITTRNISGEGDAFVPFSLFRSIFLDVLKELQTEDTSVNSRTGAMSCGNMSNVDDWEKMSIVSGDSTITHKTCLPSNTDRLLYIAQEMKAPPEFMELVGRCLCGLSKDAFKANAGKKKARPAALQAIIGFMAKAFIRCTAHADLVLVALDDVHRMDQMSWKVVEALFELGKNILIICVSRPVTTYKLNIDTKFWNELRGNYQKEGRFVSIDLPPMTEAEILELVAKYLSCQEDDIDGTFLREVFIQCGGMPGFAAGILDNIKRQNLVGELESGKLGWAKPPSEREEVFASVGELVLHWMDNLDDMVRKTLHIAAVLGLGFELLEVVCVFEQLVGIRTDDKYDHARRVHTALDTAVSDGILEDVFEGGQDEVDGKVTDGMTVVSMTRHAYQHHNKSYRFSHDMWRENILKLMLDARKKDIHRSIALVLEAQQNDDSYLSLLRLFGHLKESGDFDKVAELALKIGKKFEQLCLAPQSIMIYKDALAMWKNDEESDEDSIAGFTAQTLGSVDASDLKSITDIYIAMGQSFATQCKGKDSASAYSDALSILENAPSSEELQDRTVWFPIFSGLFECIKSGYVEQDKECSFEQGLVNKFVKKTRINGDPVHYSRALAMQGEMYGRLGLWEKAFHSHNHLQHIYDADKHSKAMCESYGSDKAAQSYGQAALWYHRLGDKTNALKTCKYIIKVLMPKMPAKNVHNSGLVLWAVAFVMKDIGLALEARDTFDRYVVQSFNKHYGEGARTPLMPFYKPLLMVLDLVGNQGSEVQKMDEYLCWALNANNLGFPIMLDVAMGKKGHDGSSLSAEICLLLAKRVGGRRKGVLVKNGLLMARKSIELTGPRDGSVGMINAYYFSKQIADELEKMVAE